MVSPMPKYRYKSVLDISVEDLQIKREPLMNDSIKEMNEEAMIEQEFQSLLNDYLKTKHRKRVEIITKAFEFANKAHGGVKRRSGEPYIMHPLAVARIVVNEIGLGSTSICAALLHDVVEDTDYTVAASGKKVLITSALILAILGVSKGLGSTALNNYPESMDINSQQIQQVIENNQNDIKTIQND